MVKSIALLIIGILIVDISVITISYMQQSDKLNEAGANISALESQVTALNGELSRLRDRVSILQSELAESEGNALALQARLKISEMNATILQEQPTNARPNLTQVPEIVPRVEPEDFTVDNLTITPSTMEPGNIVTVIVTVTNTGEQAGTYRVVLHIREESVEIYDVVAENVSLAAGESRSVNFAITIFDEGNYVLSVDRLSDNLVVILRN